MRTFGRVRHNTCHVVLPYFYSKVSMWPISFFFHAIHHMSGVK